MGYTTEFDGFFELDQGLTEDQAKYLNEFSNTRRMKRRTEGTKEMPDPVREAVGLPVGTDGGYFVGGGGLCGQDRDASVIDYNKPPEGQPCLWCQWIVRDDDTRTIIEWDGNEKFYNYVEWLEYIIENFLNPWGRTLNGKVCWTGEDSGDLGKIVVKDNVVTVHPGRVVYE